MTDSVAKPPNLIVAGVQKGGTTWLHRILRRHENVFMSRVKELNFFNRPPCVRSESAWVEYLEHFSGGARFRYRGESTPHYFWVKEPGNRYSPFRTNHNTAAVIRSRLGSTARILVILRHPVDRAVSAAHHHHSLGRLGDRDGVWDAPPELGIIDMGFYKRHLSLWLDVFGGERLHILFYEDLVRDPRSFVCDVAERLEVSCEDSWLEGLDIDAKVNSREALRTKAGKDTEVYRGVEEADVSGLRELYSADIAYVQSVVGRSVWRQ